MNATMKEIIEFEKGNTVDEFLSEESDMVNLSLIHI